jgi:hypothetical protein
VSIRDTFRERHWLTEVSNGDAEFVEHVMSRLDAGQETFGDSWAWIGVRRHFEELLEEASDLAAWSVLADQALDRETNLTDLHREQLHSVLRVAAQSGARAHVILLQALTSIDRAALPDEPEAWRRASSTERVGALRRDIDLLDLVQQLRSEFQAGEITRDEYIEGSMRAARTVWGDEDGDDDE